MRLWVVAVGHAKGTSEGALVEDFITRAQKMGRGMGFPAVTVEELPVSRARDASLRMKEEGERLAERH